MRFPDKTRKKWRALAYVLELIAMVVRFAGVTVFGIISLYQLRGLLETGQWPWMPMRLFFIDFLQIPFLAAPGSWYENPTSWQGLHLFLVFFLERVPVSLLFLGLGYLLSAIIFLIVDTWFPIQVVKPEKPQMTNQTILNIK